ncbi:hypothetical protein WHR41_01033 [Cladosporium halotolerans]|uniref:SprT-like domain-containing protein n=1 Tax=Cladosporium halotolerans TaxID=1052096 RepID=A0AB34L0M7_9PEZI
MCGDCCFATVVSCIGCCYGSHKVAGSRAPSNDEEGPRPSSKHPKKSPPSPTDPTKAPKPLRKTHQPAHQTILAALSQPPTPLQLHALTRLRTAYATPLPTPLKPTHLTPITADLLAALIPTPLHSHITILWATLPRSLLGLTQPTSFSRHGVASVTIKLNRRMLRRGRREEIWGALVHELCHAWLDLEGGWGALVGGGHGVVFERVCEGVVARLGIGGLGVGEVV